MRTHYFKTAPRLKSLTLSVGIALLAGCTVGPNFTIPEEAYSITDIENNRDYVQQYNVSNTMISSSWWSHFNDPILTELAERAEHANLDLQLTASRIEQSRARLGITKANKLPQVSFFGDYTREDISDNSKFAALGAKDSGNNYWQTGFDASWEIDLWGHIKRAEEGAMAELEATLLDREAFKVSLMAEVAHQYLQLRGTQSQLQIVQHNKAIAAHKLKLVGNQANNGFATVSYTHLTLPTNREV